MEEAKLYYNEKAKSYDEAFEMLVFKVLDAITWRYLEPYVPTDPDALVLDAGGGTGRWAIRIARQGCKVILMDASEGMLEIAAEKVKKQNLQNRIELKKGNLTKTGYVDGTFDLIFCEQTLFVFKKPDVLIGELCRVLKRGCQLVISSQNIYAQCLASLPDNPTPENLDNAYRLLLRRKYSYMTKDSKVRIYTWTPDEFRSMLERSRLQVEKIVGKGIAMPMRISKDLFMKKEYPKDLFNSILRFELALCEKSDALALAGHLQAIARKP